MEETIINIDTEELGVTLVEEINQSPKENKKVNKKSIKSTEETELINCLRNERIIVKHVPKSTGMITNPKHILYGGMAEGASRTFVVPRLSSGMYVNILTDSEKAYLEEVMGLEYNALSIYKKVDNFWDDSNEGGISKVRLTKGDNYFDLSDPEDYIRYKILLANKDYVAPSLQALEDNPKATYQFVIISEGEEAKVTKDNMSITMKCYKEFGKIESDLDILKTIVELMEGKPLSANVKIEFVQAAINNLIQSQPKVFLKVVQDPLLSTKVLIKKAIEANLISNRANYLFLKSDNSPLCGNNEEPTLNIAAKFLNLPRNQDLKFSLEAKLK
jgi:hypothetical protein